MKSTEPTTPPMAASERNREVERQARADGFTPLTVERLAALALGTDAEAEDLLRVSADLREQGRHRRSGRPRS